MSMAGAATADESIAGAATADEFIADAALAVCQKFHSFTVSQFHSFIFFFLLFPSSSLLSSSASLRCSHPIEGSRHRAVEKVNSVIQKVDRVNMCIINLNFSIALKLTYSVGAEVGINKRPQPPLKRGRAQLAWRQLDVPLAPVVAALTRAASRIPSS